MTANGQLETAHFGAEQEELLEVHTICGCGKRSTNLRLAASAVEEMRAACGFTPDRRIGTWWCWRCRVVGILTAKRLHIARIIAA